MSDKNGGENSKKPPIPPRPSFHAKFRNLRLPPPPAYNYGFGFGGVAAEEAARARELGGAAAGAAAVVPALPAPARLRFWNRPMGAAGAGAGANNMALESDAEMATRNLMERLAKGKSAWGLDQPQLQPQPQQIQPPTYEQMFGRPPPPPQNPANVENARWRRIGEAARRNRERLNARDARDEGLVVQRINEKLLSEGQEPLRPEEEQVTRSEYQIGMGKIGRRDAYVYAIAKGLERRGVELTEEQKSTIQYGKKSGMEGGSSAGKRNRRKSRKRRGSKRALTHRKK